MTNQMRTDLSNPVEVRVEYIDITIVSKIAHFLPFSILSHMFLTVVSTNMLAQCVSGLCSVGMAIQTYQFFINVIVFRG